MPDVASNPTDFALGNAVVRVEDSRLLTGQGRYTDDVSFPRQAYMAVLRSPLPAARILSIDTAAARAVPGVLAVLTGADAAAEGLGTFSNRVKLRKRGAGMVDPPYRVLALDAVRFVGEPVAAVVAETPAAAKDGAEAVAVEYDAAPEAAAAPVWVEAPDDVCFEHQIGDAAKVEQAFARAAHVARVALNVTRVSANPMEPRGAIGVHDRARDRYTLHGSFQSIHMLRQELCDNVLRIPGHKLRVISADVGGGFGMKGPAAPEYALVLWAARRTGRPVKWISERSEALLSDFHSRDNGWQAELALDTEGRFLGMRVKEVADLGAVLSASGIHCAVNNLGGLAGTYTTPAIHVSITGKFSHKSPVAAYRGAGRPEATLVVERLIDIAAREMGLDPADLRRRNLIPPAAMPYKTGLVFTYDSGDFPRILESATKMADRAGFEARRAEAAKRGRLRGQGIAMAIEIAGGPAGRPLEEAAEIRFDPTGSARILLGTHNHGQGHETVFRQIANHLLGLGPEQVEIVYGDTDEVAHGKGTFGSRSMSAGGTAVAIAAAEIVAKGRRIAAHLLEAAAEDIEFARGRFSVAGTDKGVSLTEVARAAYNPARLPPEIEIGLHASTIATPKAPTFPNGCHVCEVEIDLETGVTEIIGYWVADDVGTVVNPKLLKGQIMGGVTQGVAQALSEVLVYDRESGQLLTGSFMDYTMPRADLMPTVGIASEPTPTTTNPLGVKGAGEAGTVGGLAAAINAVCDALKPLGVKHIEMPCTPEAVWRTIQAARARAMPG
ncbi:MAG: xanthine dehydrogenase family protein molybdopterin-binding subunit [Alphaproteobacteria bacterium]|nr:xanthine dehydrogenase family protein molybdopterin-binding subunit [Alphaproteobacteria bacterium]